MLCLEGYPRGPQDGEEEPQVAAVHLRDHPAQVRPDQAQNSPGVRRPTPGLQAPGARRDTGEYGEDRQEAGHCPHQDHCRPQALIFVAISFSMFYIPCIYAYIL